MPKWAAIANCKSQISNCELSGMVVSLVGMLFDVGQTEFSASPI